MKKIIIISFLALLCTPTFSQTDTTAIFHKADSLKGLGNKFYFKAKYDEALVLYNQSAELTKDINNGKNVQYAGTLNNIALVYSSIGDYEKAMKFHLKALEIREFVFGKNHPEYANSLNGIGIVYSHMGDYQMALKYHSQAMKVRKKTLGEEHYDYATSLNNIGIAYYYMDDYQMALKYYMQALKIRGKVLGTEHPDYASTMNRIGHTYLDIGDYQKALKYYMQSMEIVKKVQGEEHPNYTASLISIGNTYYSMGDFQMALKYYVQTMEIRKKTLGEKHPDYASSLNGIGNVYFCIADYWNSLKYHLQVLEILSEKHPEYASSLDCIGNIYYRTGDYQKSLKYRTQAMEIRKKFLGENHINYASSLNGIACVYDDMGEHQMALKYYIQSMEIRKKILGEKHPDYAESLNNIGAVYQEIGDYQKALEYHMQSMEIRKETLGGECEEYASSLYNIGNIYYEIGDDQNSLNYHTQALKIRKKVLGKEHPYYAESLNGIATVYDNMGDYQMAMKYYTQALEIYKKVLGEEHPDYSLVLNNIGTTYFKMGNVTNAIKTNKKATDINKNNLVKNFSFMTAHEREAYWNENNKYFLGNIKYMYLTPDDTLATKTSYDSELITKGLLLASEISITNTIMESGDTALISEYETMKTAHLQLNKELESPIAERIYNCDSLEKEIQKMERHIMEKSKEFGDVTHFIKIDWKEVQNSLKPNDVAIEFSNFTEKDTTRYLALVLTKDMEAPVCVPLFEQSEMQKLQRGIVPAKTETQMDDENRGATTVAAKRQGIYESTGLYNMLWKPLEKYFPENPRIYFAPSGMLHQIAVEYAPTGNGKLVSDKYEMYRVSSTRFLAMDYMPKPMKNSVFYGGVYYDSDTTIMKQESDRYSTRRANGQYVSSVSRSVDREGLNYLPGTKTEVENIVGTLKKKKKVKTTLYEGSAANEESFKALSGKEIDILHIATHGFFLPTDEKMSGDQSLVQSGLLLSGANYAWQNKPLPEGIEDGILTAKEISFMDLRKTDLVVLSACQTALGEITGEGVFGLQRGFKKAGARTIIMSLWPVDDNATLLMMTEFYTNLTQGMSKREAFLAAQNKVKTTAGFENPRYWAAFIMLDGNEN